jgi:hypothetical protein
MSDTNKALWKRAFTTDPAHVRAITGKQYKGNSPKPYWIVERLTDEFGPCGIGWGFSIINERMERLSDTDVLHVAVLRFWFVLDGKRGEFEQIGQTKATYEKSGGGLMVDEDAPKKSVTDALVKCASYLGFAGDIFSGMWDDSKYVAHAAAEWKARAEGPIDRTLVMKIRQKIQEHIAEDRTLGVNEEWDAAREKGDEFAKSVWAGLTTPERDYVRSAQNTKHKEAA